MSNARLKLTKNHANAKQHLEAERLLFKNYSHFLSRYYPKIIGHILKNKEKNKCDCFREIMVNRLYTNRLYRYRQI